MSYGLYDGDMMYYPKVPFFNLELMKIASYYKKKKEIVVLNEKYRPNMYSHFIVRQDYPIRVKYPPYNNVQFGGRAFDGGKYQPLPLEIEATRPDRGIYDFFLKRIDNNVNRSNFNNQKRAEHVRLSLDGKTIWKDFDKQLINSNSKGIIFHDYNLGVINGAKDFIKELLPLINEKPSYQQLGMKFPTVLDKEEEFVDWLSFKHLGNLYSLQLNKYPSKLIYDPLEELNNQSIYTITQTIVDISKEYDYDTFITTGIVEIYKRIQDLRMRAIVFPLIFDRDFFIDKEWLDVAELLQIYCHSLSNQISRHPEYKKEKMFTDTLFKFVKRNTRKRIFPVIDIERQKCLEIFDFVRSQNYELFKLFYEYIGEKNG